MNLEEAQELLQQVLITLAKNSVHEKRLLEYADSLERYIADLQKGEAESTPAEEISKDESESKAD